MSAVFLVLSTFPDEQTAHRIGLQLVEEKLAACVNILPSVHSIYRWQGQVEKATETMAFIKTTKESLPALKERLQALHPYDVPELVAIEVSEGSPGYLQWVAENSSGE